MKTTVQLTEEQRQMVLLALAELSLERPGFDHVAREIAGLLSGQEMYERFQELSKLTSNSLVQSKVPELIFQCKCGWEGECADLKRRLEVNASCCPDCGRPAEEMMRLGIDLARERRVPDDAATATGMYDHDDVN